MKKAKNTKSKKGGGSQIGDPGGLANIKYENQQTLPDNTADNLADAELLRQPIKKPKKPKN